MKIKCVIYLLLATAATSFVLPQRTIDRRQKNVQLGMGPGDIGMWLSGDLGVTSAALFGKLMGSHSAVTSTIGTYGKLASSVDFSFLLSQGMRETSTNLQNVGGNLLSSIDTSLLLSQEIHAAKETITETSKGIVNNYNSFLLSQGIQDAKTSMLASTSNIMDACNSFLLSQEVQDIKTAALVKATTLVDACNTFLLSDEVQEAAAIVTDAMDKVAETVQTSVSDEVKDASANLLQEYGRLLTEYPVTTKATTSGTLACLGDLIAQKFSQEKYDIERGLAFLMFGALYTGAFQHVWFGYLSSHISEWGATLGIWGPERVNYPVEQVFDLDEWWLYFDIVTQLENPPSDAALAGAKVLVNQLGMVPLVYMPLFFAMTGALAGLNVNQSLARAQSLYFPLLRRNYFFWLPVQFLQFLVVPVEWQIPFLSSASLVWTVILSTIGGSASAPAAPAQIIAYEETGVVDEDGEEQVLVTIVDPGAANEITDDVKLEDVENALLPEKVRATVKKTLADGKIGAASRGFALGLLAASADEAYIGAMLARFLGAGGAGIGVVVASAIAAAVGLLSARMAAASSPPRDTPEPVEDPMMASIDPEDNQEWIESEAVEIRESNETDPCLETTSERELQESARSR